MNQLILIILYLFQLLKLIQLVRIRDVNHVNGYCNGVLETTDLLGSDKRGYQLRKRKQPDPAQAARWQQPLRETSIPAVLTHIVCL